MIYFFVCLIVYLKSEGDLLDLKNGEKFWQQKSIMIQIKKKLQ